MRRSIQDSLRHLLTMLAFSLGTYSTASIAQEQTQQPSPPGFDYWQPEWMTCELWGPGSRAERRDGALIAANDLRQFRRREGIRGSAVAVTGKPEAISAGATLYAQNCVACHGPNGMGERRYGQSPFAVAGFRLYDPPADRGRRVPLWTISEGGKQFGTDMPAFKDKLSREEIWKIIAYSARGSLQPSKSSGQISSTTFRCASMSASM